MNKRCSCFACFVFFLFTTSSATQNTKLCQAYPAILSHSFLLLCLGLALVPISHERGKPAAAAAWELFTNLCLSTIESCCENAANPLSPSLCLPLCVLELQMDISGTESSRKSISQTFPCVCVCVCVCKLVWLHIFCVSQQAEAPTRLSLRSGRVDGS